MAEIKKTIFILERSDLESLKTLYLRLNALESLFTIDEVCKDLTLQEQIKGDIITTKSRWKKVWSACRNKYSVPNQREESLHFDFTTGDVFYYEESDEKA